MGNAMGGVSRRRKRRTKVMKMNGESLKITTPITASEVTIHHPNHLLYESQSLYQFGLRAKPLDPHHQLKPKALYFLLQLPPLPGAHSDRSVRRVHSDLRLSASDRLESLMLSRRSLSDLHTIRLDDPDRLLARGGTVVPLQVKFRVPRTEFESLMKECESEVEVVEKIVDLCVKDSGRYDGVWKTGGAWSGKACEKRVRFVQKY